jgi:hypothetical protein
MEVIYGSHKIEFFEGILDMPFERFNYYNKYVMLDSELGSTVSDFDKIVVRINEFVTKDMKEEATKELLNLRFVVNNILSDESHKGLAFATLIKKFDGKEVNDYSTHNLKKILSTLSKSGLKVKDVLVKSEDLKKKSKLN